MTDIQKKASRLAELQRVRVNAFYDGHPDDVAASLAVALKYISGTAQYRTVLNSIADGLDAMIAEAKDEIRAVLD